MLQLDPPLRVEHEDGRKGFACLALDYSQDHDTLFLVGFDRSREFWWVPTRDLRVPDNISLGRPPR